VPKMFVFKTYRGEVVLIVRYPITKLPSCFLNDISPIESLMSFIPSTPLLSSLPCRVFGCVTFVNSHNPINKLDLKALNCVFIGYPSNKKEYEYYHHWSYHGCHIS